MQVIEWTVKWTGMDAAKEVIWSIKGIEAWLVQTYRPGTTKHDITYIPPMSRPPLGHEKINLTHEKKPSSSSYRDPFSLVIMSNWSFPVCGCPRRTQGNKLLPIQCISSSHRTQVIASCSTSPQQILSVADKAALLFFSWEHLSFVFFILCSLSIVEDLPDGMWGRWYWSNMLFSHFKISMLFFCC